jgi:hypothetical protein
MQVRAGWAFLVATLAGASAAVAITPPSSSDGPVKLLACVVSPAGILEAEVASSADETLRCDISCGYELGEHRFTHTFSVSIRSRFQGRVGRFDTNNARPGNYSGEVSNCAKP